MSKKLGNEDAYAVDLLLDRTSMVNNGNAGSGVFAAPVGDAIAQRIGAAESLLRLVGEMPVGDPPKDLVHRTLERIRRHIDAVGRPVEGRQQDLGQGSNQV